MKIVFNDREKIIKFSIDEELVEEYKKDVDKYKKKHPSLPQDLETLKQVLSVEPKNRFSIPVSGLQKRGMKEIPIYRIKKIKVKSLGNKQNNPYRLVYALIEEEKKVILIQLYKKLNQKSYLDEDRILKYFRK